ncbi:uncharacterized protein LOC135427805 [Drosophila montana]|uniref:uncharacterized protein LOC135427805 n=1 Tax=Drosophila montana TaxID=40370 RepID=UPI00313C3311
MSTTKWPHQKDFRLADPNYFIPQGVDILLGSDIYDELMLGDAYRGPTGSPLVQNTHLVRIESGKINERASLGSSHTVKEHTHNANEDLNNVLRKFWELELFDNECPHLSLEERWCKDSFVNSHYRLSSGKYLVRLPFLSNLDQNMVIGSSYRSALKRLDYLDKRLRADPKLKNAYCHTNYEYVELGQIERVTPRV